MRITVRVLLFPLSVFCLLCIAVGAAAEMVYYDINGHYHEPDYKP